jgi:transposase
VRLVNDHQCEYSSLTAAAAVVAKQLGVGKESVRRWVIQSQVDGGQRAGTSTEELPEIKRLKAENKQLREDVEILRGATTFFVGELDPRGR